MRAIVQDRHGGPEVLTLREIPAPAAGDDQVLVRVHAASVNFLEWGFLGGLPPLLIRLRRPPVPRILGIDLSGQVEAIGQHVTRFKPGDEVFGAGLGAFADYATAREDRLAPKPRNLTFEQAAAMPIAGCTALQGLRDAGDLRAGQSVVVYGAGGGVGTFAVQIAKALGAHVTAVTSTAHVVLLRALGADDVLDYTIEDFTARGNRYDVLFDIGANRSFADCRRTLALGGRWIFGGTPRGGRALFARLLRAKLASSSAGRPRMYLAKVTTADLVVLKDLAEAGKLTPAIDRHYPLGDVSEAIRYLGTRQVRGKLVITVA